MYVPETRDELSSIIESLQVYAQHQGLDQVSEALSDAHLYLLMAENRLAAGKPLFKPDPAPRI